MANICIYRINPVTNKNLCPPAVVLMPPRLILSDADSVLTAFVCLINLSRIVILIIMIIFDSIKDMKYDKEIV